MYRTYLRGMTDTSPAVPTAVPLDEQAVIAITGDDAKGWLQSLLTADIAGLKPGAGTFAALLTPQGKIVSDMLVFDASDEEPLYLIDAARAFADDLASRLERYRLRARVVIERLAPTIRVAAVLDAPAIMGEAFYTFADPRHAALGQRIIGPAEALDAAIAGLTHGDGAVFHMRRLRLGIAETGRDYLPLAVFPHEANLDQTGGVDFAKGCYVGQEIVSRMEHRGTARTRTLCARFLNGFGVSGGADVMAGDRVIGHVGESIGDRAVALVRIDRLAEAISTGDPVTAAGVPVELTLPVNARFEIAGPSRPAGA